MKKTHPAYSYLFKKVLEMKSNLLLYHLYKRADSQLPLSVLYYEFLTTNQKQVNY